MNETWQHGTLIGGVACRDLPQVARSYKLAADELLKQATPKYEPHELDYGRTIGDVYFNSVEGADIPPGATLPDWNINRELIQQGLAWHYKKYSSDINLEMDEITARQRKLGLWSDARHVAPWDWRKLSKAERDKLR